jgi:hypothetical protein
MTTYRWVRTKIFTFNKGFSIFRTVFYFNQNFIVAYSVLDSQPRDSGGTPLYRMIFFELTASRNPHLLNQTVAVDDLATMLE